MHVRHDVAPPHELAIDITSIAEESEEGRKGEMKPIQKFTLEPSRDFVYSAAEAIAYELVATQVQEWWE